MQVQYCLHELQTDFPYLWEALKKATTNLYDVTARVCHEYERPAIPNVKERAQFAQQMYKDYGPILEKIAEGKELSDTTHEPDKEPTSYIMGVVKPGDKSPEAYFLLANLSKLGYDVLWLGLDTCLRDFQQKKGLQVDGICGEKTWGELLK